MFNMQVPNTIGGIQQVRMFPGGLCFMPQYLRNVLVTVLPNMGGRVSTTSVLALTFVERNTVVILDSFPTENVQGASDGEVYFIS